MATARDIRCTKCGAANREGAKFCSECAMAFAAKCPQCGAANTPGAKFCDECAASLTSPSTIVQSAHTVRATAEQAEGSAIDGERKTVTALFADLKGSTALMEDLDPEEARAIIDPALRIMIDAVRRYDGYVVQSTGDGIFALFGAPAAYEDHPQRGLYVALQMQRELREHGERRATQGQAKLEARIGVNTGEVVVRTVETGGRVEYTPIGHTANLASRLQTLAPPGSIAISEHTRRLCEGYFELRSLGPTEVRGISEPINVYEVVGIGALRSHFDLAARRGLTKFVGRESELEQMQRALELAMSGHGQIVAVIAEAGTGKSRLFYEFKATLPAGCKVLEAYSVSHGKASAWLPVLELLRGYFGIQDADEPATRREKVRTVINKLDQSLNDALPYLFGLLGIVEGPDPLAQTDPQIKRRRTLDAIKRVILRESLNQRLVVVFEDLHWIDEHTQALLDLLVDSGGSARVLLLVNYRPEYRHAWGNKSHYVQLGLNPLGRESAEELLAALLEDALELRPLKRLIIERTGGNPFFIEEMVQALFDERILVRNGIVRVTRSLSQIRIPPTVQGILAARIDRLSAEQKELLQTLAVIGRESPLGLIRQVASTTEEQLERMLAELRAAEFIYEQPALADTEYIFKHALTQEVAYNSLLIERRKHLHERAGQALESMLAGQLDDHLGELARQYSHSDNISKAVEYLGRAGRQALQRSAYAEAISLLTNALELLKTLQDTPERSLQELTLQITLGVPLTATKGYSAPEVGNAYTRARELCQQIGETPHLIPVLFGLWRFYLQRAELQAARELGMQCLSLSQRVQGPARLLRAHNTLGITFFYLGELASAREHLEQGIALYRPQQRRSLGTVQDPDVVCLSSAAWVLWYLGYPDQALKRSHEALALADELSHPYSCAQALFFAAELHHLRQEAQAAEERAEAVITLAAEQGFPFWLAQGTSLRGWALVKQGLRRKEGIEQIRQGLAVYQATGAELGQPYYLAELAEACGLAGQAEEGLRALAEALVAAHKSGERMSEAELYRLKGELLLLQNASGATEAESCFRQAIEIAQRQQAKSWELRATMSLARLLDTQGKRDEARTMLAEIYGWFTEGFDTADLKDAKALLDELNM